MVLAKEGWAPSRIELALAIDAGQQSQARAELRDRIQRSKEKMAMMRQKCVKAGYTIQEKQSEMLNALMYFWRQEWGREPNALEMGMLGLR